MRKGSDTPRTDAVPRRGPFHHYLVDDVFNVSRQLERELNQWKQVAEKLAEACEEYGVNTFPQIGPAIEAINQLKEREKK